MKTWKQNGMAFIAVIALAFAFTACPEVKYVDKEVPVEREIFRGNLSESSTNRLIPIWQSIGVTDTGAVTVIEKIALNYFNTTASVKNQINGRITKIMIVDGTGVSCSAAGVVSIGINNSVDWIDIVNIVKSVFGIALQVRDSERDYLAMVDARNGIRRSVIQNQNGIAL